MRNFHIIRAKFLPATDYYGVRIKLTSDRFQKSVTFGRKWTDTDLQLHEIAINYLQSKGFEIAGFGEMKDGMNIVTNTFESL
jgi:hypothetical protein